jgi:hypothetical protein
MFDARWLHTQLPIWHVGAAHDSTYHCVEPGYDVWHVGGHGAQSASLLHCAAAHAPWKHAVGHWESDISHTQDPASHVGLTYVTTEAEKQVGAGCVQSAAVVHVCAGGTMGGSSGDCGLGPGGETVSIGTMTWQLPFDGSQYAAQVPHSSTVCFQWHCPSLQEGSL